MTGDTYGKKSIDHYYVSFDKGKYFQSSFHSFNRDDSVCFCEVHFIHWKNAILVFLVLKTGFGSICNKK